MLLSARTEILLPLGKLREYNFTDVLLRTVRNIAAQHGDRITTIHYCDVTAYIDIERILVYFYRGGRRAVSLRPTAELVTLHAGGYCCRMNRAISYVCEFVSVCVCVSVRTLKGKRLELSTSNTIDNKSEAVHR